MDFGTFGWNGEENRGLEFPAGVTPGLSVSPSPIGRARLRYNDVSKTMQVSLDGSAYADLGVGGASPWVEMGGTVRLQDVTNEVVIGAAATVGTEKLRIVGDTRIDSSLFVNTVSTAPASGVDLNLTSDSGNIVNIIGANPVAWSVTDLGLTFASINQITGGFRAGERGSAINAGGGTVSAEVDTGEATAFEVEEGGDTLVAVNTVGDSLDVGTATRPMRQQYIVPASSTSSITVQDPSLDDILVVDTTNDTITMGSVARAMNTNYIVPASSTSSYTVQDPSLNNFLAIDTTNGTITLGNTTTNPDIIFDTGGTINLGPISGTTSLSFNVNSDGVAGSDEDPLIILTGGDGGAELIVTRLQQDSSADLVYLTTALSTTTLGDTDRATSLILGPSIAASAGTDTFGSSLFFRGHRTGGADTSFHEVEFTLVPLQSGFNMKPTQQTDAARPGIFMNLEAGQGLNASGAADGTAGGTGSVIAGKGGDGNGTGGAGGVGANLVLSSGDSGDDNGSGSNGAGNVSLNTGLDSATGVGGDIEIGFQAANIFLGAGIASISAFLDDNNAAALSVVQGINNYLLVDTTNGSEGITLGNATTNPPVLILGTGGIQFDATGAQSIDAAQSAATVAGVALSVSAGGGGAGDAGSPGGTGGQVNVTGAPGGVGSATQAGGDGGEVIVAGGDGGATGGAGGGNGAALRLRGGSGDADGDIHIGDVNTGGVGFFGTAPSAQSAAYTRNAAIVEDRTLLASASATTTNNNNVLAALIADLQAFGLLG